MGYLMDTPDRVIFVEGSLEAREWPAVVTGQSEVAGALHLLVTPPEGDGPPFEVRDVPHHPAGRPGYWKHAPAPADDPMSADIPAAEPPGPGRRPRRPRNAPAAV